ncbi:hypothetical protein FIBSPDRAFT_896692 [Athelia psychrophila]|uniref:Uncharacterized protein n=1 Tax=Athelia psychrophila TaxID=1759441 RepID=A0A166D4U4_9AGAM|nr:hypothetical protein FIBSPDRAFT_896692 [Fibularhizoctonia sp. CBS 109695]
MCILDSRRQVLARKAVIYLQQERHLPHETGVEKGMAPGGGQRGGRRAGGKGSIRRVKKLVIMENSASERTWAPRARRWNGRSRRRRCSWSCWSSRGMWTAVRYYPQHVVGLHAKKKQGGRRLDLGDETGALCNIAGTRAFLSSAFSESRMGLADFYHISCHISFDTPAESPPVIILSCATFLKYPPADSGAVVLGDMAQDERELGADEARLGRESEGDDALLGLLA